MTRFLLAVLAACVYGLAVRADDKMISPADLDKKANKAAFDAADVGTKTFNAGDQPGCLKLYEGSLMTLATVLDHRPDLVKVIKEQMAAADKAATTKDKAFALRKALDAVMDGTAAKKPLWERLGGEPAVKAVVHDFVAAAAGDKAVNFLRDGKFKLDAKGVEQLERYLVELVSATTGGPLKYTGRDMKSSHAGMKITDAEFDALAGVLVATLKKYKVPQAEIDELVGIVATTRKDIVEVGKKPLWDRLGGEAGVSAVLDEFLATAGKDPKANIDRNGNYPLTKERGERVKKLLVEQVSSITGGPYKYTGRDMKNTHAGMKITEDEFNAAAGHLIAALKKYKVPQAEADELIALIASTAKDIIEVKKK
jgi:truncated hemoglobin YjbI